jgi:hypothetical protein
VRPLLASDALHCRNFCEAQSELARGLVNQDTAFLRNRVRHRLLPTIGEEFGEAAIEHMGELAEIAQPGEHWVRVHRVQGHSGGAKTQAALYQGCSAPLLTPAGSPAPLIRAWLK